MARSLRFFYYSNVGFLFLCALTILTPSASGQENTPIVTDRPDFVESSKTVEEEHLQIETSFSWGRVSSGVNENRYTTPTLFRYGFHHNWELRLETEGLIHQNDGIDLIRGFADLSIGVKNHIHDGEQSTSDPSIGWLFHMDIPSGSEKFRGYGLRPSIRAAFQWDLPPTLSLAAMPGVIYHTDGNKDRFTSFIFGAVLGQSWSDRLSTFGEIAFRQLTSEEHGGNIITYDIGLAFLLKSNVQLDTAFFIGANDATPDWNWTAGFSILL